MCTIEKLKADQVNRFKAIRLRSLKDDPDAFGTTIEDARNWPEDSWEKQVKEIPTFIATTNQKDIGVVRAAADDKNPSRAWIISMWVAAEARGKNIGGLLIDAAVDWCLSLSYYLGMLQKHVTYVINR
jgi:GNAT superfamily N-acetyltransferase